jgi:secondary thiamine-phosphate synthase enzyme
MATEVIVPEVGEVGMDVTFVRWLKGEGDEIRAGEALFEVDTAKAVMEVEAYVDGRLADLRVGEGDLVTPHQVVALILSPGEELSAAPAAAVPSEVAPAEQGLRAGGGTPSVEGTPPGPAERPGASPRARRLARDRGVDLATVRGTGADGLITEADVERAAATRAPAGAAVTGTASPAPAVHAGGRQPRVRELRIESARRIEARDVTDLLLAEVLPDGFAWCATQHTTAALLVCEGDPDMLLDIERTAEGLFAPFEPFQHRRNNNPNAAAHLVSSTFGTQLVFPVVDGRIQLGPWQRVVFLELDGPRERRILVASMAAGAEP